MHLHNVRPIPDVNFTLFHPTVIPDWHTMEIFVNGEPRQMTEESSVAQLLNEMGIVQQRLAIEINREIVPRSAYAAHQLKAGDKLEMVHAVGGG